ncbi:MAG: xanthine dehydrogenase molybdopterin binding subunit [Planctomycetaceae bacterium]|nr:xanthine dehydrogenase molybdopterin binding subunit [Planctomycetaceae bacterium]
MSSAGKSLPHDSAVGHVTGRALYLDDERPMLGELHVGFVGSPIAAGTLEAIDATEALALPGVVGCWTAADVPGHNLFGLISVDEPFLPAERVDYVGQPVAVIAAETPEALAAARRLVRVDCTEMPPVLDLDTAIREARFLTPQRRIARGDAGRELAKAPQRLSGVFRSGGQEQFYLESQAAIAYPGEEGRMVVHSSTQNTTEIQGVVAEMLGRGQHEVVAICKRMGGAFGGKETQASLPALMAALVAHHTGRPARVIYNKDDDMCVTGKRHEYVTRWDVGFEDDGRLLAIRFEFFSNGGAFTDLSPPVLDRTLLHADNCYYLPHVELLGRVCYTNVPPNTAFRGFGGPQAMAAMENVLESIAQHLDVDALDIRQRNLYGVGERNVTPYGQVVERNHLPEIFTQLAESCDYRRRREEIAAANAASRLTVRGLAITGVKFGISFTATFLNQGNALVNVYMDGTVQVSTGGTEMGQGLNTKIQQLVAEELGVDPRRVRLMPTSTEKNNNTSPTAASASTDINGAAAVKACREIKERLAAFAAGELAKQTGESGLQPRDVCFADDAVFSTHRPEHKIDFGGLCMAARRSRVDLGARGFFATPGIGFDQAAGQGTPFFYYTQGAAAVEVQVDRFTGELTVPRADLLIDIGRPINLGIDRGQVIGGFIQGLGWATAECLLYGERGELLSHSPTTYKIPAATDVPPVFNVALFDNDDNVQNIRRSKAVGEPPLMLGIAAWAAVKDALAQVDSAASRSFTLPATGEEILRCLSLAPQTAPQPSAAMPDG